MTGPGVPPAAVPAADARVERHARMALPLLFGIAVAQRLWNMATIPALTGFDAAGHMGYVLTIVREHRLPHPTEGWSTFHPPLYYLVASVVWTALEPLGPRVLLMGIRGIGVAMGLAAALVTHRLIRRLGGGWDVALVATALVLFVPCIQMSATMEGNEAFAAGVASLGLPPLLALQSNPRSVRAALAAGLCAGLAAISKFTGLSLLVACAVPFLRLDLDRTMLRALAAFAFVFAVVAGPVYVRNVIVSGSPFPMTRMREPMYTAERSQIIRPRRVADYFSVYADNFRRPSVYQLRDAPGREPSLRNRNQAMTSVPGLLYAALWYDPFANRIAIRHHRDGVWSGPVMMAAGLLPTLLLLAGFLVTTRRSARLRLRAPEAPLVVMTLAGTAMFVFFTWASQSTASVKGTYLLPLAPAAGVFFANGTTLLRGRVRAAALLLSLAAAAAAAAVFTEGVLFWTPALPGSWQGMAWASWARQLPNAHIDEALHLLL